MAGDAGFASIPPALSRKDGVVKPFAAEVGDVLYERRD